MAVQSKPLFGRYTDAELIGAGVTGEVYRATDSLLGRVVAVRVLAPCFNDDLTVRQRFIRETLAAAPVSAHPHIVTLYDAGDWKGQASPLSLPFFSQVNLRQRAGDLRAMGFRVTWACIPPMGDRPASEVVTLLARRTAGPGRQRRSRRPAREPSSHWSR